MPARPGLRPRLSAGPLLAPGKWRQLSGPGAVETRRTARAPVVYGALPGGAGGSAAQDPPGRSQDPWQHLLRGSGERVLLLSQVGLPGLGVPDLKSRVGPDHGAVALQAGVGAQRGRDGDTTLLVGNLIGGTGEEDAAVVAYRLGGHRRGAQRLGDAGELVMGEEVQAAFLPFC